MMTVMNLMMTETSDNLKYLIIDIETNGLLNTLDKSKEVTKVFCIVTKDLETGEVVTYTQEECYTKFKPSSNTIFIGHLFPTVNYKKHFFLFFLLMFLLGKP